MAGYNSADSFVYDGGDTAGVAMDKEAELRTLAAMLKLKRATACV